MMSCKMRSVLLLLLLWCSKAAPLLAAPRGAPTGGPMQSRQGRGDTVQRPLGQPVPNRVLPPPTDIQEVSCPTGDKVRPLNAGMDLFAEANTPGFTYELEAGEYRLTQQIVLDTKDSVTCYKGMGPDRGSVVIKATTGKAVRAFEVDNAQIGFFNLVLDGQDTSAGVKGFMSGLTTRDVTVQRFRCADTESNCALVSVHGSGKFGEAVRGAHCD